MSTMLDKPEVTEARIVGRQGLMMRPQLWGAVAIAVMWVAVLFVSVYGGDVTSVSTGAQSTTIPSAVFVSFFAFLATVSVAKRAFRAGDQAS
ncbi:hypothetical protein [Nocardioides cynanchi]|uniref:hypothetical protein n=1 Tax=Nocardioides cynanchi TaxID=2558918 RepID=UPI0012475BB4|nr:hypothetical protein [Nocardioides cynanchi]